MLKPNQIKNDESKKKNGKNWKSHMIPMDFLMLVLIISDISSND